MELVNFQLHRADMPIRFIAKPPSAADLGKQLKKKWMDRWFKRKKQKGKEMTFYFFKEMNGWNLTVCGQPKE